MRLNPFFERDQLVDGGHETSNRHSQRDATQQLLDRHGHNPPPLRFTSMEWIDHLQWPAMVATLSSAWLVAAQSKPLRRWGFWIFLVSNVLWVTWSVYAHAYALVVLQIGLAFLNIRGVAKNE